MEPMKYVGLAAFLIASVFLFRLFFAFFPKREYNHVRFMARVAVFAAISTFLYVVPIFKFSLPIFPSFLEIHIDEIPAFIAGFAYGPISGIAVIFIKTALKFVIGGTSTMGVGELTDLILSSIYVFIATFVYNRKRNLKGVAIGFSIATVVQVLIAMILNVYVMIPFYMNVMNFPLQGLLAMMRAANPAITDVGWSYAFFAVLPFNLVKDAIVIVVTFLMYRSLHVFLRFEGKKKKVGR